MKSDLNPRGSNRDVGSCLMRFVSGGADGSAQIPPSFCQKRKKQIYAYPKLTAAVCMSKDLSGAAALSRALVRRGCSVEFCSLTYRKSKSRCLYCLCLGLLTRQVPELLPCMCEHSDAVLIGSSYYAVIKEHAKTVISDNAVGVLSEL